ncbi:hypothetical protein [Lacrimispora indolis]|uniref:hypothetical protein n=1 Tax=Lacrimispora indolis TaxID=69825 RepID=UPI000462A555|nr:hypothetical protein [[Clostridium] methoxybenzovorans]
MKHGLSKTRLYGIYSGMKQRCYNPANPHYSWYGAKGITICDEWLGDNGLQNFFDWALNNGYNENLTIDRIESDKEYSPENCQWITSSLNSSRAHITKTKSDFIKLFTSEKIRFLASRQNVTLGAIAEGTEQTSQNFSNKMKRDDFKQSELASIAEFLGYELKVTFIDNETGEEI